MSSIISEVDSQKINYAWNPRLAHLRCFAASLVLMFHIFHVFWGGWKPHPNATGWGWIVEGHTGVSLFFVLSGFLFMSIVMNNGIINYKIFIRNRFLRIAPLFLMLFLVAISLDLNNFKPQDFFYIFFANLGESPTKKTVITAVAWTIPVEFAFYLIFPFISSFSLKYGYGYIVKLIFLLLLLKIGGFLISDNSTNLMYFTLLGRFDQFLIGMLASFLINKYFLKSIHGFFVILAFIVMWILLEILAKWGSFFLPEKSGQWLWSIWLTVEALGWASVIIVYLKWKRGLWKPISRFLEYGGEISFSIYIWHGLIIFLISKIIGIPNWFGFDFFNMLIVFISVFLFTFWVARLSYVVIEEPFLNMKKRYIE